MYRSGRLGDAALVLPSPVFGIPGFAGRAERTARNTLENCLLFAVLALTAHVSGATPPLVLLGAQVFVVSRLVFIAVYYLGMMVRGMF